MLTHNNRNNIFLIDSVDPEDPTLNSILASLTDLTTDLVTVETEYTHAANERVIRKLGEIDKKVMLFKKKLLKLKQIKASERKIQRTISKNKV